MKYKKSLDNIQINFKEFIFIDYGKLNTEIKNNNFLKILTDNILNFDEQYKNYYYTTIEPKLLFEYLLINYLSVNKILKKMQRKNKIAYEDFKKKYKTIDNFFSIYKFYNDILNLPEKYNYKIDKTCPICLDDCTFPVYTECNHVYCWKCLFKTSVNFDFCPICKNNVSLDPAMIFINNLLKCDKKYSPFNNLVFTNKQNNQFDIVSDLHIDQWSTKYKNLYPCGEIKDIPYTFGKSTSDYLIVAGDISDSLEESINYLENISEYYKNILFVDGNHEHVCAYPKLFENKNISDMIKNNNIKYLSYEPFQINNTIFVGCCGWWDYNNSNKDCKNKSLTYFDNWIPHFTKEDNLKFIENVIEKSIEEFNYLKSILDKYEKNDLIENIVIVTHTVPKKKYCNNFTDNDIFGSFLTEYNTKYEELFKYKKISHWIFGHTHQVWYDINNNIQFICNPRGRPEDFDRTEYKIKQIII